VPCPGKYGLWISPTPTPVGLMDQNLHIHQPSLTLLTSTLKINAVRTSETTWTLPISIFCQEQIQHRKQPPRKPKFTDPLRRHEASVRHVLTAQPPVRM
jgi:hypothetical protein